MVVCEVRDVLTVGVLVVPLDFVYAPSSSVLISSSLMLRLGLRVEERPPRGRKGGVVSVVTLPENVANHPPSTLSADSRRLEVFCHLSASPGPLLLRVVVRLCFEVLVDDVVCS